MGSRRRVFADQGLGLIPATDRNRFKAVEFLAGLESRGGTEIAEPLDRAVKLLDEPSDGRDRISFWSRTGKSATKTRCSKCSVPV